MSRFSMRSRIALAAILVLSILAGLTIAAVGKSTSPVIPTAPATPSSDSDSNISPSKPSIAAPVPTVERATVIVTPLPNGNIRAEFQYPVPTILKTDSSTGVMVPGLINARLSTGEMFPVEIQKFVWPNGRPNARIVSIETGKKKTPVLTKFSERLGDDIVDGPHEDNPGFQPTQFFSVSSIGKWRGIPISSLKLYPVRYNAATRELLYIKRVVVEITGNTSAQTISTGRPINSSERTDLSRIVGPFATAMPTSLFTPLAAQPQTMSVDNGPHVRIDVRGFGIYRVTGQQLANLGVPIRAITPRSFRLSAEGVPVPYRIEGDEDGRLDPEDVIEFFGRSPMPEDTLNAPDLSGNRYTDYRAYILSWSGLSGVRMPEISAEIRRTDPTRYVRVYSGPSKLHFEQNNYPASLGAVYDEYRDRWFWDSGVFMGELRDYLFYLPYPDTTSSFVRLKVRVAMHSLTNTARHQAYVLVNHITEDALGAGRNAQGQFDWIGQQPRFVETSVTTPVIGNILHHRNDTLTIFSPQVPGTTNATSRVALNWFDVEYPRLPIADNDEVRIGTPSLGLSNPDTVYHFELSNFTSPDISVYRTGSTKLINGRVEREVTREGFRYKISFQDAPGMPTDYYAVAGYRKTVVPDTMLAFIPADSLLSPPNGGAEYLVIGPRYLLDTPQLTEILNIRGQQYNRAMSIDIEQILTRFNEGMFHPKAIRDFLKYAVSNWSTPPRMVMLLGDAVWNQQKSPRRKGAIIPHPMMPVAEIGSVGTDTWYSMLDNDGFPDIPVSRVSARTVQEAGEYFDKVIELEHMQHQERWQNNIMFIRGDGGNGAFDYHDRYNQTVLGNHFDFSQLQVESSSAPNYGFTSDLLGLFNRGTSIAIYNGHGSGEVWAANYLFRLQNVAQMQNTGRYPLICNFSCFIMTFNGNNQRSTMGEEFLFAPRKGAAGVYGTTGLGYLLQGLTFQDELFKIVDQQPGISYGDLILDSKAGFLSIFGGDLSPEMGAYNTFWSTSLLGDPGLRMPLFDERNLRTNEQLVLGGDSLNVSVTLPFTNGDASFRWYRSDEVSLDSPVFTPIEYSVPVTSNNFQTRLRVPTGLPTQSATLRAFFTPATGQATRASALVYLRNRTVNGICDSLVLNPAILFADSQFTVSAKLVDPDSVIQIRARVVRYMNVSGLGDSVISVDTVTLAPDTLRGTFWYTCASQASLPLGRVLSVKALWTDLRGGSHTSDSIRAVSVLGACDLAWPVSAVSWVARDSLFVTSVMTNYGSQTSPSTRARITVLNMQADTVLDAFTNVPPIGVRERVPVSFFFPLPPGQYVAYLLANADHIGSELNANNNTIFLTLSNTFWWLSAASGSDTLWYQPNNRMRVQVPAGSLNRSIGVIKVSYVDTLSYSIQQGMMFATFQQNVSKGRGVLLEFPDTTLRLSTVKVEFVADTVVGNRIRIHGRNRGGLWKLLPLRSGPNGEFQYEGPSFDAFALLDNQDRTPPRFNFAAEGQIFSENGYIRRGARFSAMAYDAGGLDLSSPGSVLCVIDGDTLPSSEMMLPYGLPTSRNQSITLTHQFAAGRHWAKLDLTDMAGNTKTDSVNFIVVNDFRLDWVGNFPNPFSKTTTFFYNLTDQTVEPVEIAIFTVSGRKIRTLRETQAQVINYRELIWDGRDDEGQTVANGVYFYRFTAKNGSKTIEHRGKLAKLR